MTTVAVTGASGLVGGRLLRALAADPSITRLVGVDVREPERRVRGLEFHRADIARSELKPLFEGVDVLVHLASVVDPIPDEALMARVNIDGTRRVLDAASAVGVTKVVRVSSAAVYGAWENNPVPLDETVALRPNVGFSPAIQAAEVERLLAEWRGDHPSVVVTTLRTAPVLGPGAERLPSRLIVGRPPLRVRGATPPVQVAHVDDLVRALELVVHDDHPGTFNVACSGWLEYDEVQHLVPRGGVPAVPAQVLERALARSWSSGLGEIPPGVVPYLIHPWVISTEKLEALGWRAEHTNEAAIREAVADLPPATPTPRTRALLVLGVFAAGAVVWWVLRRASRRGATRSTRPTRR